MSITNAFNSAVSGLGAASRSAQVVSSNIANALTPGYGRREIALESAQFGGVNVADVTRVLDPGLLGERRASDAAVGYADTMVSATARLSRMMGDVGSPASLPGRIAQLGSQLTEAASQPSSDTRLLAVAHTASDLAQALNLASDEVQSIRLDADKNIASQVGALNDGLARIDELNDEILRQTLNGGDVNGLKDIRQAEIDRISGIVPIREIARPNGGVALITTGGLVLLDDRPAEIEFTPTNAMAPGLTLGSPLSGLTVNGLAVDMTSETGRMAGGSLQANFEIRDDVGIEAQAQLDGFARDLIERVAAADPTLAPGDPALFTDAGAVFNPVNEAGLAGRISLNTLVDPQQGAEVWRLRDGLGAAAPGPQGDASLLNEMLAALTAPVAAGSAALGTSALSLGGQADYLFSSFGTQLFRAEQDQTFLQARSAELVSAELQNGVDTDAELQKLLLVEQIYAANTKVIQAADSMLQTLLEI